MQHLPPKAWGYRHVGCLVHATDRALSVNNEVQTTSAFGEDLDPDSLLERLKEAASDHSSNAYASLLRLHAAIDDLGEPAARTLEAAWAELAPLPDDAARAAAFVDRYRARLDAVPPSLCAPRTAEGWGEVVMEQARLRASLAQNGARDTKIEWQHFVEAVHALLGGALSTDAPPPPPALARRPDGGEGDDEEDWTWSALSREWMALPHDACVRERCILRGRLGAAFDRFASNHDGLFSLLPPEFYALINDSHQLLHGMGVRRKTLSHFDRKTMHGYFLTLGADVTQRITKQEFVEGMVVFIFMLDEGIDQVPEDLKLDKGSWAEDGIRWEFTETGVDLIAQAELRRAKELDQERTEMRASSVEKGARVRVVNGLEPHNGKEGVCGEWNDAKGRYLVALDSDPEHPQLFLVRNLEKIE